MECKVLPRTPFSETPLAKNKTPIGDSETAKQKIKTPIWIEFFLIVEFEDSKYRHLMSVYSAT